jgi:dihydroneopterin aldolase
MSEVAPNNAAASADMADPLVASPRLVGLMPDGLRPVTRKVMIEALELMVDIGFHAPEIGVPQRVVVDIEVWLDAAHFPSDDVVARAWDYHWLHETLTALTTGRRFRLQETLAHEIYALTAARAGVKALRVATRKPDVYADCASAGVVLASF